MRIDAHQHFWIFDPVRDSWIDETMKGIKKDFLPEMLAPILKRNNFDGCVAVQADQSEIETQFLLDLAKKNTFIKAVVGWVDLCADNVEDRLAHFSENKKFKGLRHIVQAEADDFMLRADFQNGISKLQAYGLTYDVLVFPKQLPAAIALVKKFPNQQFVVDHMAKPPIKKGEIKAWKNNIEVLAECPNVVCKLSGMLTEANLKEWKFSDFTAYMDVVFTAFGIERILYGSDWPVCLLAATYTEQLEVVEEYISKFSIEDKAKIMGRNAVRFYNLDPLDNN